MLLDEDYPTSQKSSAVPFLSSHSTKSDIVDTPLFPVQDGCGQFSALPNPLPGFASNNSGLSPSPTLATEPTFPGDRGTITPSPGLTWLSPVEISRSALNGNIAYDDVFTLNSDDLLGQKTPFCASEPASPSNFPISPKLDAESLPGLRRYMTTSVTCPQTPIARPQSLLRGPLPTNFDWVLPDAQSSESSESIDQPDVTVNAYTPVAVVSELVGERGGIFAPTPGIFLSPLLDTQESRAHTGDVANGPVGAREV